MIQPGEIYMADFGPAGPHPVIVVSRESLVGDAPPRTNAAYFLIPEADYEAVQELLEEEQVAFLHVHRSKAARKLLECSK